MKIKWYIKAIRYVKGLCRTCGSEKLFVRTENKPWAHCPDCGETRAYQLSDRPML